MTAGNGSAARPEPVVLQVQVPDDVDMRALVGPRDEVLRTIERGFPHLQVHVRGSVVTLEMQGIDHYQATIDLWQAAVSSHASLGLTLPADIRRAERDVSRLAPDGARLRLCVGSYPVPPSLG